MTTILKASCHRNTGADTYTAMKRMACNNSRWKAANQSKDWRREEEKNRMYIVIVIIGMPNKRLLQRIVFIFRDMSVSHVVVYIIIIHHTFIHSDINNNRRQKDISLKMNCCNRCLFTIQITTVMIYIRGIIFLYL